MGLSMPYMLKSALLVKPEGINDACNLPPGANSPGQKVNHLHKKLSY